MTRMGRPVVRFLATMKHALSGNGSAPLALFATAVFDVAASAQPAGSGNERDAALLKAASDGDIARVQQLLGEGANIEAKNRDGNTPLNLAAWNGKTEAVRLLLEKRANIAAKDVNGTAALALAAHQGQVEVVKLLLETGTNIEAKKDDGTTALGLAAFQGQVDVVKLLLEKGADIEAKKVDGNTPLNLAAWNGKTEVVKLLLEKRANIEAQDSSNGTTTLGIAAFQGHADVVRLLLEKGANIGAKNQQSNPPLNLAAWNGKVEVVRLLLEKSADIESRDVNGTTTLGLAAFPGQVDVVRLLLEKGADIEGKNRDGNTPLNLAAWNGKTDVVRLLLEKRANIEAQDINGTTTLGLAAHQGQVNVVRLLLEKGANIRAKNRFGNPPLNNAAWNGKPEVVKLLLEKGESIETRDTNGTTTLGLAASQGQADVVRLLLEKGANIRAKNHDGNTPPRLASIRLQAEENSVKEKPADPEVQKQVASARETVQLLEKAQGRGAKHEKGRKSPADAKTPAAETIPSVAPAASVKKGDRPPGRAMAFSVPQARAMLRAAIAKKYSGPLTPCSLAGPLRACVEFTLSPAVDVRVRAADFSFAAPGSHRWTGFVPGAMRTISPDENKLAIAFAQADYLQVIRWETVEPKSYNRFTPKELHVVGFLPTPQRSSIGASVLSWTDALAAQDFVDAFNRLVYAAHHQEDFSAFAAAAKSWRANPIKPPLNPESERLRAVAEKALDDQNLDAAVENYESALEAQPMWPEGWYSLALLYGQQNNYQGAANCMRHYLELVPDAPDAKESREKMAGWEANRKQ